MVSVHTYRRRITNLRHMALLHQLRRRGAGYRRRTTTKISGSKLKRSGEFTDGNQCQDKVA